MIKMRNIVLALLCGILCSCSLIHNDEVVARAAGRRLYRSEVVKFIPPGLPASDSLALARQYINAWAGELILTSMAQKQLSKSERDVSREIEDYRSSLLKYRYEQHYLRERLDTAVSDEQIEEHYRANIALYRLDVPIVKARYVRFPSSCPLRESIIERLSSDSEEDAVVLDSLSWSVVGKFTDYGGRWVDMVTLSRDFGMDYGTLIAAMRNALIDLVDEQGTENVAYVSAITPSGRPAPLEYCSERIRDAIISQRKHVLSSTLEQDLLNDALENGTFVIYDNDEK